MTPGFKPFTVNKFVAGIHETLCALNVNRPYIIWSNNIPTFALPDFICTDN